MQNSWIDIRREKKPTCNVQKAALLINAVRWSTLGNHWTFMILEKRKKEIVFNIVFYHTSSALPARQIVYHPQKHLW